MQRLKVLTLNCWGVPTRIACKLRGERMEAIGDKLGQGEYDVIILQEIWDKGDYSLLQSKMTKAYPYSHYFYSGAIGSGVCVFSKHIILDTFYCRFSLNGYAHKIHHGDWFGGKGVGMCIVSFHGHRVSFFCTHLHAEYNISNDEYLAHRVSQAFEMSQYVKLVGGNDNCDLVVAAGDFNLKPTDLGYKILRANCHLHDSWLEKNKEEVSGHTCDIPSNSFTDPSNLKVEPDGKRIDHILFRSNKNAIMEVEDVGLTMGKIPGRDYNFSDHEGVTATFQISQAVNVHSSTHQDDPSLIKLLTEAQGVVDRGLIKASADNKFYTILAILSVCLLYMLASINFPYGLGLLRGVILVALTLFFGFCIWHKAIINRIEVHGLKNAQLDLRNLLNSKQK